MTWGLAIALRVAALLALVHAVRLCLSRLHAVEQHILGGRGLSPSLLLATPITRQEGRG